jgi:hypothetical protein
MIPEIVYLLLDSLLDSNYKLYMDNWYNSVHLSSDLLDHSTYTVGTLRKNRGEPAVIRNAGAGENPKMKKGDIVFVDNGKVMVVAWHDNRKVVCISTCHDDSMTVVRVRKRGGGYDEVNKPVCVVDYNQNMSGVDRIDQMISYYPTVRKTIKWLKKLFSST